jgi:hypothetical protein
MGLGTRILLEDQTDVGATLMVVGTVVALLLKGTTGTLAGGEVAGLATGIEAAGVEGLTAGAIVEL